nr:hypothetical protein [uncultured Desulfobacter sp.]
MRNVFVGLICLLSLVLFSCAGMQTKSGYYVKEEGVKLIGHQMAIINYGIEMSYLSHEEADEILKPMKGIMDLPIGFDRDVFLAQYRETKQGLAKYSGLRETYRSEVIPQIAKYAPGYVEWYGSLVQGIAKEKRQHHVAFMNQLSQVSKALEESSEMYQQSTEQMMNDAMNQLPKSKPIVNYNESNQPRNYLINTDEGNIQRRCMTMSDGSVFCY